MPLFALHRAPLRLGPSVRLIVALAIFPVVAGESCAQEQRSGLPDDHPVQIQRRAEAARNAPARVEPSPTVPPPAPTVTAPLAQAPTPTPPAGAPAPPPTIAPTVPTAAPVPAPPVLKIDGAGVVQADEAATLRADVVERLKALESPPGASADGADAKRALDPAAKLAAKALQEVLQERLKRLDDFDKAYKELVDLKNPDADPERKLADAKAELQQIQDQSNQPLEALLPSVFTQKGEVDEAGRAQMKEAIEGVKNDVKEFQDKLEASAPEPSKDAKGPLAALRGDRDKIAQRLAALKARGEGQADAPTAKSAADRKLADEKWTNLRIETTVETLRSQTVELKITRAGKATEIAETSRNSWIAHVRLGRKLLERMQGRYRELAEADARNLENKAKDEQAKAKATEDPLERYRAGRLAELLDLEAVAVKIEQAVTASPKPSLEEQRGLAVKATKDLERIKAIIAEDRLSPLDTIQLNTDYRKIVPDRERVQRNELAKVEKDLQDYGNALTSAELELIEDSLVDQVELLNLLDALPAERHDEAEKVVAVLEVKHRDLLTRRRDALRTLVGRASETLGYVNRRLEVFDEEYTFIRTHLFWVRDKEPIGLATVGLGWVESRKLAKVVLGLVEETTTPRSWRRLTPAFLASALVALMLPLGLLRIRIVLRRRLVQDLPHHHPLGDPSRLD